MNVDEIREIREQLGVGLAEAKRIAQGRVLLLRVEGATTVQGLKPILAEIIKTLYPDPLRRN